MGLSWGQSFSPSVVVFACALLLDLLFGEPPNALHPVAWMGTCIAGLVRFAPRSGALGQLVFGGVVALVIPCSFAAIAAFLLATVRNPIAYTMLAIALLKPMFALKGLGGAAGLVREALATGQIARARESLRGLCSRDPSMLDEQRLVAGTVESLAENASDSLVAPLFYYVLLGVPGIAFYRAVNTLDAMIGYHGRYEYIGKVAARFDDALNLIPARLTALFLLLGGALAGKDVRNGWRVLRRDGKKTESPNAGRPMAAMAGLLGVELEKEGHYRLGDPGADLGAATISTAWRVVVLTAGLVALFLALSIGVRHACFG